MPRFVSCPLIPPTACRAVFAVLSLLSVSSAYAVESAHTTAASEPVATAQLEQWLSDLSDDDYAKREAASRQLLQAGVQALETLKSGVQSDNAEIAWRAGVILEQIAITGDEATLARISSVLQQLSAKGRPGLKSLVQELHQRQKRYRHDRAVAALRSQGGQLTGVEGEPDAVEGVEAVPIMVEAALDADAAGDPAIEDPFGEPTDALEPIRAIGRILLPTIFGAPAERAPEPPTVIPQVKAKPAAAPTAEEVQAAIQDDEDLPSEKTLEKLGRPADAVPGAEAVPVAEAEIAVEAVDGVDAVVVLDGVAMIGDDGEAESSSATLILDQNWKGGDDGLQSLQDIPEIVSVRIVGAKLSDRALDYVAQLPNLQSLLVQATPISSAALRKFRGQKPEVEIVARCSAMLGVNADPHASPLTISGVQQHSGADLAGLRQGDCIKQIAGQDVKDFSDLVIQVYGHNAGDKLRIEYERGGAQHSVEVTLSKRPNQPDAESVKDLVERDVENLRAERK